MASVAAASLLSLVPAPEALPLRHIADASVLPDFTGRVVGLVPLGDAGPAGAQTGAQPGGFRLALEGDDALAGEMLFTGTDEALAGRLAQAEAIAAPSLQDLLRRGRAWDAVPLDRWFDLGLAAYLLNPEDRNYSFERLRLALFIAPDPFADPEDPATDAGPDAEPAPHPDRPGPGRPGLPPHALPPLARRRTRRAHARSGDPAHPRAGGHGAPGRAHRLSRPSRAFFPR
jgi:hypothetical protein